MAALPPDPSRKDRVESGNLLVRLALDIDQREARLCALAHSVQALDLRLARLLAWLRDQDLHTIGFPGWEVFLRERVDWSASWVRDMVRLVRSGLTHVIEAACRGDISLTLAVKAPGWCGPAEQEQWVARAVDGTLEPRSRARRGPRKVVDREDQLVIGIAREKARLLTGLGLSDEEADRRILAWWQERPADLVEQALAPAPRPARAAFSLDWSVDDPATPLIGPWRTPRSLAEGLQTLDSVQAARKTRVVDLGLGYEEVVRLGLHRRWGYPSVEEFCQQVLGMSARSLQRYQAIGRALRQHPHLSTLPLDKAEAVARVGTDVDRWGKVAERTGNVELARAVAHVEAGADPTVLLAAYEAAMGATTTSVALDGIWVPVPRRVGAVDPDLPEAARWLLREVPIPVQKGFGLVKELADYVCANPECRRRALRNHAHHRLWRSHGGTDALSNGDCDCPSCHLRLIHPGHVRVERIGDRIVWTWPDRVVTVFLWEVLPPHHTHRP